MGKSIYNAVTDLFQRRVPEIADTLNGSLSPIFSEEITAIAEIWEPDLAQDGYLCLTLN